MNKLTITIEPGWRITVVGEEDEGVTLHMFKDFETQAEIWEEIKSLGEYMLELARDE